MFYLYIYTLTHNICAFFAGSPGSGAFLPSPPS